MKTTKMKTTKMKPTKPTTPPRQPAPLTTTVVHPAADGQAEDDVQFGSANIDSTGSPFQLAMRRSVETYAEVRHASPTWAVAQPTPTLRGSANSQLNHGCSSPSLIAAVVAQEERRRSIRIRLPAITTPGFHNRRSSTVVDDGSEASRSPHQRFPGLWIDGAEDSLNPPSAFVFHEGPQQFEFPLTRAAYLHKMIELKDLSILDPGPQTDDMDDDDFRDASHDRARKQVVSVQQQHRHRTSHEL